MVESLMILDDLVFGTLLREQVKSNLIRISNLDDVLLVPDDLDLFVEQLLMRLLFFKLGSQLVWNRDLLLELGQDGLVVFVLEQLFP